MQKKRQFPIKKILAGSLVVMAIFFLIVILVPKPMPGRWGGELIKTENISIPGFENVERFVNEEYNYGKKEQFNFSETTGIIIKAFDGNKTLTIFANRFENSGIPSDFSFNPTLLENSYIFNIDTSACDLENEGCFKSLLYDKLPQIENMNLIISKEETFVFDIRIDLGMGPGCAVTETWVVVDAKKNVIGAVGSEMCMD